MKPGGRVQGSGFGVVTALCRRADQRHASTERGDYTSPIDRTAVIRLALALAMLAAGAATAQEREPHAGYIFPAGGRPGTSLEARLGGQFLDGAGAPRFSGGGVRAEVIRHYKILTQQQVNGLRNNIERIQALEEAAKTNATLQAQADTIRRRVETQLREAGIEEMTIRALNEYRRMNADPKQQLNPAISEYVTLRITVDAGAAPGEREVRLPTALGLTNPIRFQVGGLPELREEEPNESTPEQALEARPPFVINGQIMPGDVDRFRFTARKGQRLVAAVAARALIPYLADAVPGWFQATLGLYDADGRELAYADDHFFDPDPVILYEIPADGDYVLEIKDSIYRGREDFVYRLTVGEVPFLTGLFPLGGRMGERTTLALAGWNLPRETVSLTPGGPAAPHHESLSLETAEGLTGRVRLAVNTWPELKEENLGGWFTRTPLVPLPVVINGRIEAPKDADRYRFQARASETLVAEVQARRLGSPLDSRLRLLNARGDVLATNDDTEDKGAGLYAHQADSHLAFTFPAAGVYTLEVADTRGHGSPAHAYRCRIGPPQPDFELRVVPASLNLRAGATRAITVFALRRDGFNGDIALKLEDAPEGFTLGGAWIPAGQDKIRLTVTAPAEPAAEPVPLRMTGEAVIGGQKVRREAVPSDDLMQAFFYRHLVPAEALLASVTGRAGNRPRPPAEVLSPLPVRIAPGASVEVRLRQPWFARDATFHPTAVEPPEGITVEAGRRAETDGREDVVLVIKADAKVPAGLKGNLLIEAAQNRPAPQAAPGQGGQPARSRSPLGLLPAIPFEITGPKS